MIGKVTRGSGFGGLADYLLRGHDGNSPERVEWTATRNLYSDNPERAAGVMRATATRNVRVEKPVYHLSINLDPNERLTRQQLEAVVDRTLKDIGLHEHQAMMVAHNDADHQHVHVMINRVHPEHLRAWHTGHDYARIETSLRQQEREFGLREVPGRHAALEGQERYVGPYSINPEKRLFTEKVAEVARQDMREAKSWDELHRRLAEVGLKLEKRGRGLSVTDGEQRAKASDIDRGSSLGKLEQRLGKWQAPTPEKVPEQRVEPGRFSDIQQLKEVAAELKVAKDAEAQDRRQAADKQHSATQAKHEYDRTVRQEKATSKDLDTWLSKVFRAPKAVRQVIDRAVKRSAVDAERVIEQLDRKPQALGKLRGRGGPFASRERWAARDSARYLPRMIRDWGKALRRLNRAVKPMTHSVTEPPPNPRVESLTRQAAGVLQKLGWKVAARVIPAPQMQVLRVVVKLTRTIGKALDHGMNR